MINLKLNDNNLKEFESALSSEMDKAVKHFERELITIRTGRAHPALVEGIKVSCYDTMRNLKEIALISAPEARMIVIEPWDKALIPEVEKAISNSDVGVTPFNDGNIIRIKLPEISTARRDELVKVLHKKLEEARIAIRNVRKDFHNLIRDSEKGKKISEDHGRRLTDTLQKITDKFIALVEQMSQKKENEVKTI
jgi:ribosome recycling factor